MQIYSKSDVGLKRTSNQDNFACDQDDNVTWAAVCDGMGGISGGDIASKIAVDAVREAISSKEYGSINEENVRDIFIKVFDKANEKIFCASMKNEKLKGMGTTMVLSAILGCKVHVAHVGDSRAYLLGKDNIKQLTMDHSIVQQMIDKGEITVEEAKEHPKKNIITRAIGAEDFVVADYICEDFKDEDTLLMCTDGLTNYIDNDELLKICNDYHGDELVDVLISTANNCGGSDNITVVVIQR